MNRKIKFSIALLIWVGLFSHSALTMADDLLMAEQYRKFGLTEKAKEVYIQIAFSEGDSLFSSASNDGRPMALYSLGVIAFDENRINLALEIWNMLTEQHPASPEAKEVSERLAGLAQISGESMQESVENAVAASFLKHGDFWSSDRNTKFTIDSSWIKNVESANFWYDKVIAEFPGSVAARMAFEHKMQTLLGWKERGQYGSSYGVEGSFDRYMPQLLETFATYEKQFSEAGSLQAFRYQIAQAYWSNKDWGKTREWLNLIIESSDGDSFYSETAKLRLQKIEY
ncbi:hypothetical protein N9S00_08140 [Luminiphilus sp.]|nr:hypothetical protein [Luminiphilus sp.]